MSYLLDTHTFLWCVTEDPRISKKAREIFLDKEIDLLISVASIWEMAIKVSIGKLDIIQPYDLFIKEQVTNNALTILPARVEHVIQVARLEFHHRDPFDRLLISQAIYEGIPILGSDSAFDLYGVQRVW